MKVKISINHLKFCVPKSRKDLGHKNIVVFWESLIVLVKTFPCYLDFKLIEEQQALMTD